MSEDSALNFFEHRVVTIVGKALRAKGMEGIYVQWIWKANLQLRPVDKQKAWYYDIY